MDDLTANADMAGMAGAVTPALAGYTGHLLRRAATRTRQVMQLALPAGAQPRDYAILGVLAESDAISQQDLAERLSINRTVMVKLIDRLDRAGSVLRSRNPVDRRSYILSLTPAGRDVMEQMRPAVARGESELTGRLQPAERHRLNELLRRLLPDVDQSLPHPPAQRTGYLLVHADLRLHRRSEQALLAVGLQTRTFGAMATLEQIGSCTQQELATQLGVTEAATVQLVDDLEEPGFVERQRDVLDRRRYALKLTDKGELKLVEGRQVLEAVTADVVELLGPDGDRDLRQLLARLV